MECKRIGDINRRSASRLYLCFIFLIGFDGLTLSVIGKHKRNF